MRLFQGPKLKLYHWSYIITSKLHMVDVLVVAKDVEEARAKIAAQSGGWGEDDLDLSMNVVAHIQDVPKHLLDPGAVLCLVRPVR
jgi:hypothetical protein